MLKIGSFLEKSKKLLTTPRTGRQRLAYLENILSTIVYKDIMLRHNVTDKNLLERIVNFMLDNIGQPLSTKKIVDTLNGNQIKTSF